MKSFSINVEKVDESGYEAALRGLAHNKKQETEKMAVVAEKLAGHTAGTINFLKAWFFGWMSARRGIGGRRRIHFG
jgi:hypothetical protein